MLIRSFSPTFGLVATEPAQWLRDQGWQVELFPPGLRLDREKALELIADCDALVTGMTPLDRAMLLAAPRLKVITMHGTGVHHIDLAAAKERGVVICNVPGGNQRAVAELTLGLVFSLARSIPQARQQVLEGGWSPVIGCELGGKTLGIVGLGKIGQEVARLARALGMEVVVYNRTPRPTLAAELGLSCLPLEDLLARADFICLHLPLTPQTRGLIGARELALAKPGAFLLNLGRGGVVDEEALYQALVQNRLAGAALDVLAQEPPQGNPLLELPQVIVTPHIGGYTVESLSTVGWTCARNIAAVLSGGQPPHPVNT
ncbi:MAG: phosphoglycerate dehydrogenase [Proteobacteria bacterium]|nr:phosphoglycerate dehydrogenase [Pseudomonadota bacterium]MBU1452141.1 phosphoglycerate dehydrogenase [Pseudomonadota bacterium]MBU2467536.1 phosphoglycerate dehydrogenase [Pseudomonadota bacterium]MBU2517941.1 phosphoglycerate dehydrogenase [Pseudomonadota bacterium]